VGTRLERNALPCVFGFYLLLAVLSIYPLSLHPTKLVPDNADALEVAWRVAWVGHQLPRDPTNLLRANIFFPEPRALVYGDPMVGLGLLALPFYALTGNDVLTFNLLFILTLSLSGLTMFLLAREVTGSAAAALLAGEIFAFTTANYDSAARLQIVSSQWTPLALFFLVRFLKRLRPLDGVGFGLAFAFQGLACSYYKLFFATLLVLSFPFFFIALPPPRMRRELWIGLLLAAVLAGALLVPLDLPQYRQLQKISAHHELREGTQGGYLQAMSQNWVYGSIFGKRGVSYDERYFTGLLPLALTGFGLALSLPWCRRLLGLDASPASGDFIVPFVVLGAMAFLLGCGREIRLPWGHLRGPFQILHALVPGYAQIRVPSRFAMFVRLAMALLSAYGLSVLFPFFRPRRTSVVAALLALLLPLEHLSTPLPTWPISSGREIPEAYRWLASQKGAAILEYPPNPPRLRREESFWMHFSTAHWLPMVNGYTTFYPPFFNFLYDRLLEDLPGDRSLRLLRALGVEYVVFHPQHRGHPEGDDAVDRFERRMAVGGRFRDQLELVRAFEDDSQYPVAKTFFGGERIYRVVPGGAVRPWIETKEWRPLSRAGWRCESEPKDGDCLLALDGNPQTAFTTRREQRPGDFMRVLFPRGLVARGVFLLCGRYALDYPRQVEVFGLVEGQWVKLPHRFDDVDFLRELLSQPERATMKLAFEPTALQGLEIRLGLRQSGFSAWQLAEIDVYE